MISSAPPRPMPSAPPPSFNLVIEVLLISRLHKNYNVIPKKKRFNLVIEVLLISRTRGNPRYVEADQFQSRNRGSFDFKAGLLHEMHLNSLGSFNLVIEVLLISSVSRRINNLEQIQFQSRNRGSFDFKSAPPEALPHVP